MLAGDPACPEWDRRLCSRLRPSPPLTDELDRAALFADADGLPATPLLLIEAPAGYGKTILIRQWWTRLKAQGVRVAWLSFTENACNDRSPLTCFHDAAGQALASAAGTQDRSVLFLDDIHHAAPAIVAAIAALLRTASPGLQVVATSRNQLSRHFAVAGMADMMSIRRWSDLAYTMADLRALLHEQGPSETLDLLCYRLKGWPAMVHLLHGVARHWPGAVMDLAFDRLPLDDAHHYFMEEMYNRLDPRERAVFDLAMVSLRLTPARVADVLDLPDAAKVLQRLEHYHGLLEVDHGRYRVHELIRSLARRTLPADNRDMHRRIAHRSERRGHLAQAVFHAVEARDGPYAIDMLRRAGGWNTALQIGSGTIDRLSQLVTMTQTDFQLAVAQTYALLQSGRIAEARRTVDQLKRAALDAAARSEWIVLDLLVAHYQNRIIPPDLVDRLHRQLADEPGVSERVLLVLDTHFRAYSHYDVGEYRTCLRWLDAAGDQAAAARLFYAQVYALVFGALTHYRMGDLSAAHGCLHRAEQIAGHRLNGIDLERHQGMIQIFSALIAWEGNDEALTLPEIAVIEGRLLSGYDSWPPVVLCFYLCTSEMIVAQQDLARGLDHLDRGIALAHREGWHRIVTELTLRKAFLSLEAGALRQSAHILATLDPAIATAPDDPHLFALARFAQAWQALGEGDADATLAMVTPVHHALLRRGHDDNAALGCALAALAKERRGDTAGARELIATIIGPMGRQGYSRWFRRLRAWAGVAVADIWPSGSPSMAMEAVPPKVARDELTDREREILRLVADGHCAKEIARLLKIKPNTVTSYRKQGYRKLGISKRSELSQRY